MVRQNFPSFTCFLSQLMPVLVAISVGPSLQTPAPLSDARPQHIYDRSMLDLEVNNVRALAVRNGISTKRVDATLWLKGLEASWEKVRISLPGLLEHKQTDSSSRLPHG